jgi:hypothetical protein
VKRRGEIYPEQVGPTGEEESPEGSSLVAAPSALVQPISAHATGGGSPTPPACPPERRAAQPTTARTAPPLQQRALGHVRVVSHNGALPLAVAPLFLGRAQGHAGNVTALELGPPAAPARNHGP